MDQELTYRLGKSVPDLRRAVMRRAAEPASMQSNTFKLLGYLMRNAGRVIGPDELFAAIWPRAVVTDGTLARSIREVRRWIGDERRRVIHTVPGRGYIYKPAGAAAPAAAAAEDDAPDAVAAEPRVALLPFSLHEVDEAAKPAFEEMAREIRTAIANSRVIVVQPAPARARGGVDYLVEAQVLGGVPHLNMIVTLSNARSGHRLLTQAFFLKAEGLAAFHQNVARQVVSALVFNIETASWQGTPQGTTSLHVW